MSDFEITVKINMELNELLNYLQNNRFVFHQSFRCIDIFLIKKEEIDSIKSYEDLNKCIILRELLFKDKILKYLVIKNKTFDQKGNVIDSKQENITIKSVVDTKNNYLKNGYIELIRMDDYCYTFSKNRHEFIIEHIPLLGTFVELENLNYDSDVVNGNSVEELIALLDSLNLNYDKSDYFCKKAWLLIENERLNEA